MSNSALFITTFFRKDFSEKRLFIFQESMSSLLASGCSCDIVIIDDGSDVDDHLEWLEYFDSKKRIKIYKRPSNGGIAKAKNTSIRLFEESSSNFGFLADDDLIYSPGWDTEYVSAINSSNNPHFCAFIENSSRVQEVFLNGCRVRNTPWVNGCFLTITKPLINNVGYFKIFPYKYGHEHSNFTMRCCRSGMVPGYYDIVPRLIDVHRLSHDNKSISHIDKAAFDENNRLSHSDFSKQKCIE